MQGYQWATAEEAQGVTHILPASGVEDGAAIGGRALCGARAPAAGWHTSYVERWPFGAPTTRLCTRCFRRYGERARARAAAG